MVYNIESFPIHIAILGIPVFRPVLDFQISAFRSLFSLLDIQLYTCFIMFQLFQLQELGSSPFVMELSSTRDASEEKFQVVAARVDDSPIKKHGDFM